MAELQPIIVFHGHHFVRHLGICNPICVKLLQIMSGVISRNLKQKRRLYLKPFFWGSQTRHTNTQTDGHTHTHTHDDSIRRNAMRCISPKNYSIDADIERNTTMVQFSNFSESNCEWPWLFTCIIGQGQMWIYQFKDNRRLSTYGNCNVCSINHRLRDICSRNMHNLDLDLYNGPRPIVNVPIKSQYTTFYMVTIACLLYLSPFARQIR